eukprot:1159828-Pelagomonas_calceolata.AAC.11
MPSCEKRENADTRRGLPSQSLVTQTLPDRAWLAHAQSGSHDAVGACSTTHVLAHLECSAAHLQQAWICSGS